MPSQSRLSSSSIIIIIISILYLFHSPRAREITICRLDTRRAVGALLTAVWQAGDSEAAFCCRQDNAADPPGLTPEQCDAKSSWQAERIAASCALVGC